jgi:predicted ATP-dependent endonuclease of OLD family
MDESIILERMQVEEGFLNGLDLRFGPGLNVIIGGRGTGKTSVIELLRFCLAADSHTPTAGGRSREHALAVLGHGEVTVSIRRGTELLTVSRTASESRPRASNSFRRPLVFSQTEVETLGLEARNRLRLIDSFVRSSALAPTLKEQDPASDIRSLSEQIAKLAEEFAALQQQEVEETLVKEELSTALTEQEKLTTRSKDAAENHTRLRPIVEHLSILSVRGDIFKRARDSVHAWRQILEDFLRYPPELQKWPNCGRT